ncbi:membrane protein [Mycobacterium lepromatosis]|nr:membrane protein [Mycobacterium lepromatosis]
MWTRLGYRGLLGHPQTPTERTRPGESPTTLGQLTQQTKQIGGGNAEAPRARNPLPRTTPPAPADQLTAPKKEPAPKKTRRRLLRDPLTIVLILIIVVALVTSGLVGAEFFARHTANNKVAQVVACEVKDQASAKFGVTPLLLWQITTRHFTNISVETAGNQIRDAKGMKIAIDMQNVEIRDTPTARGTIGVLDATITWSSDGIKQSVQNSIPVLGAFVTNNVTTHPANGTIELKGMLNDIVAKPVVSNGGLQLQIINFNTLGFSLPKETVQFTLDDFTANLTKNYPLGIHADSVEVTSTGVISHFSTQNANIPPSNGGQDPCFANL